MFRRNPFDGFILPVPSRRIVAAFALCAVCLAGVVPGRAVFASEKTDRDALVALYRVTNGDDWLSNDNWLTNTPTDTWYGVITDGEGRVIQLDLSKNDLSGFIPPELGRLTRLQFLNLSDNQLRGAIPLELGNLLDLKGLYLDNNQLSGSIPPELGNLSGLQGLGLSSNRLSGAIPSELGNLVNLSDLYLFSNQLRGEIPIELYALTNLEVALIGLGNQWSGCIPETWRNVELNDADVLGLPYCVVSSPTLTTTDSDVLVALFHATYGAGWASSTNWLTDAPLHTWYGVTTGNSGRVIELSLPENKLRGAIPPELGNLSHLEWLDLSENELTGAIPPELGNLRELRGLTLGGNSLTGAIPPELGNLINLTGLALWSNGLNGAIPSEIGNLSKLKVLYLSNNALSGSIPPELGKLTNLEGLTLWNNRLSGTIPPELGALTRLEELDLENNRLTGAIPGELGNLDRLEYLYLSGNQLSGCVPQVWRSVEENDFEDLGLPFCVASTTTSTTDSGRLTSVQIFKKVSPAIAFIETAISTGSGVLVEGGYLVTNAHVVWPFNEARVVFPDGVNFDQVPVVGWDNLADLAVLGPISSTAEPLTLVDGENLPIGADVYLIGYPGEFENFPQPAIGRGLLARLREWESIGITYFQTDAIAIGGQSGGALVSETGGVIGISGFRITEGKFGFVASSADLLPRIRQLIAGEDPSGLGDRRLPIVVHRHRIKLRNYWDDLVFVINEPANTEVTFELVGDRDGKISVYDSFGEKLLDIDEEISGAESGSLTVEGDRPLFLTVRQLVETPTEFSLKINRRLTPFDDPDRGRQIQVGQSIRGNIDFSGDVDHFILQLEENEAVEIVARSALADTFLTIDYLGAKEEQIVHDNDSGGGLFGLDSRIVYRAPHSGSYFVVVRDASRSAPGGYIISVKPSSSEADSWPSALSEFGYDELRSAFDQLLISYTEIDPAVVELSLEELPVFASEGNFSHLITYFSAEISQMIVVASGQISDVDKSTFDHNLTELELVLDSDTNAESEGIDLSEMKLMDMTPVGDRSLGLVRVSVEEGERQRVETITFRRGNLVAFVQTYNLRDTQGITSAEQVARALDSQMTAYLSGE